MKTILQAVSIRNFKKIDNLDLDLTGDSYLLTGPNGVGKSSVIQAIMMALNLEPVTDNLVTKGKDKGEIVLRMKRDEHEYSSTIKLRETKDQIIFDVMDETKGIKVKGGPKTFLTAAAGPYVDIFKILSNQSTAAGRKENEDFFLKLANLDPDKVEYYRTTLAAKETTRTATGRLRDSLQGYVAETRDKVQPEVYKEKKDLKPLYDEHHAEINAAKWIESEKVAEVDKEYQGKMKAFIDDADLKEVHLSLQAEKNELEKWKNNLSLGNDKMMESINQANSIQEQIKALQAQLTDVIQKRTKISEGIKMCEEKVYELSPVIEKIQRVESDLAKISEENAIIKAENSLLNDQVVNAIEKVRQQVREHNNELENTAKENLAIKVKELTAWNEAVDAADVYRRKLQESIDAEELWKEQQQEILDIRKERTDYIMTGVFPIPEMKYDEDKLQIVYQGMPLSDQLMSTGNIIKLGVALNTAYNPDGVNILAIPNASLLDEQNMKDTLAILKEHEMIGLFELVKPKGNLEITVIKDNPIS